MLRKVGTQAADLTTKTPATSPKRNAQGTVDPIDQFLGRRGTAGLEPKVGKKGIVLPKVVLMAAAKGDIALRDTCLAATRLVDAGASPDQVFGPIAAAIAFHVGESNKAYYSGKLEILHLVKLAKESAENAALRPFVDAVFKAILDRALLEGRLPKFVTKSDVEPKAKSSDFGDVKNRPIPKAFLNTYLTQLAKQFPPTSPQGWQIAAGLGQLEFKNWIDDGAMAAYLRKDAPTDRAMQTFAHAGENPAIKGHGLEGITLHGTGWLLPQEHIVEATIDRGKVVKSTISTGNFVSRVVRKFGDEIFAILMPDERARVPYLDVFDAKTKESKRRVVLPRPINHFNGRSMGVTKDGHLVFGSSSHKSQDLLVRIDSRWVNNKKLDFNTVQSPRGYKIGATTVDGDHAYVALCNDGRERLKVMRFEARTLKGGEELIDVPMIGFRGISQIAVLRDRVLVACPASIAVFEMRGRELVAAGALPIRGVEDICVRDDGGLDLSHRVQGQSDEMQLVRLSPAQTAEVFLAPFAAG